MAHFAELDTDNIVTQVIVVDNNDILDEQGNESEALGIQFCTDLLGGTWVQTSYNDNIRYNFAGIGFTYDETRDAFIAPQPFDSWLLDKDTCQWKAPIPYPDVVLDENGYPDKVYEWDEETIQWIRIDETVIK
jgi:hypothetical protein